MELILSASYHGHEKLHPAKPVTFFEIANVAEYKKGSTIISSGGGSYIIDEPQELVLEKIREAKRKLIRKYP